MQCQCTHTNTSWFSPPLVKISNSIAQIQRNDDDDDDIKFGLPAHVKSITSTSNPFVKHCLKLRHSSSYRHSHASALVVGATPIREIYRFQESLRERTVGMDCLLLFDKAEVPEGLDHTSVRIVHVSSMVMKKLSGVQSTESIEAIALMRIPTSFLNVDVDQEEVDCRSWFPSPHRILVLDGIQDPGNLGTLLRSAMAFKWGGVFLLPGCCDPFNDKALRASRGASFQLPIVCGSWYHLEALKNEFQMKMLAGHPESDKELKPVSRLSQGFTDSLADVPLCLVLGSEGRGLSEKSQQACDLVSIPMAGDFESLNVSVAAIIVPHLPPSKQVAQASMPRYQCLSALGLGYAFGVIGEVAMTVLMAPKCIRHKFAPAAVSAHIKNSASGSTSCYVSIFEDCMKKNNNDVRKCTRMLKYCRRWWVVLSKIGGGGGQMGVNSSKIKHHQTKFGLLYTLSVSQYCSYCIGTAIVYNLCCINEQMSFS